VQAQTPPFPGSLIRERLRIGSGIDPGDRMGRQMTVRKNSNKNDGRPSRWFRERTSYTRIRQAPQGQKRG
jgi:hypothetical protein